MSQTKENIKKISSRQGLYLGAILSLLTIITYFINWDVFLSPWFQFSKFLIVVSLAIYATLLSRKAYFHDFSFRDGFSAFFITIAVGLGIFTLVNWLLFDFLVIEAGHYINNSAIEIRREQLESLDQDSKKIEEEINFLKENYQFSFKSQFKGYLINLVLYCLIAPLAALIFKTKKPIIR